MSNDIAIWAGIDRSKASGCFSGCWLSRKRLKKTKNQYVAGLLPTAVYGNFMPAVKNGSRRATNDPLNAGIFRMETLYMAL